jgi:hypothetical protein
VIVTGNVCGLVNLTLGEEASSQAVEADLLIVAVGVGLTVICKVLL